MLEPKVQTFLAAADLSAKQYYAAIWGATDASVNVASSTANIPMGVIMNAPTSGQEAEVARPGGGAKLKIGATVAIGDLLKVTNAGKGTPVTANNDYYFARAEKAGVDGDVIPVILVQGYYGA